MDELTNDLSVFPLPSWPQDIKDDYASCKTDAERLAFLLHEGYDILQEPLPEQPPDEKGQHRDDDNALETSPAQLVEQPVDQGQNHEDSQQNVSSVPQKPSPNRPLMDKFLIPVAVAVTGSLITRLITGDWDWILQPLARLIDFFSGLWRDICP